MAIALNGTNQFLSVPVSSDFEFGTGDFTVAYTIKINSFGGNSPFHGVLLGAGANGGSGSGSNLITCAWFLRIDSNSFYFFRYDNGTATLNDRSFSFSVGQTYNVLATRLGTSLRLYVNGAQVGASFTDSISYNRVAPGGGSQDLFIGRMLTGAPGLPVPGQIYNANYSNANYSDIAIWKAGLTDAEITALSKGFAPNQIRPQSLSFYLPLVSNIQDLRGAKAITNNNGATVATHPRIYT